MGISTARNRREERSPLQPHRERPPPVHRPGIRRLEAVAWLSLFRCRQGLASQLSLSILGELVSRPTFDNHVQKGSAELLILSLLEARPRHGYEVRKLIEKRSDGVLKFNAASLYALLYRLETRGLVERRPDPRDRRIWRLHLQLPAHAVLREIDWQRADIIGRLTDGIDDDSLETVTETLLRMKAKLIQDSHASRRGGEPADADAREVA